MSKHLFVHSSHRLRRRGNLVLRRRDIRRVARLAPGVRLHADIGALLTDRVGGAGADTLEPAAVRLPLAAVQLLARHAGTRVAETGVDVSAGGAAEGV